MNKDALKKNIEENLLKLRQLRDETRLDVHLAGMEAKSRWERLEGVIAQAEKLADDVSDVSRRALNDVVEKVRQFRDSMRREDHTHP